MRANKSILAAVPPCAGECRIVRGYLVGITPVDPDLWGFCGGAGDVLAAGLPASCMINSSNSMPSTAVTERPGLASPAGEWKRTEQADTRVIISAFLFRKIQR